MKINKENAFIMHVYGGANNKESQDWVRILKDMYQNYLYSNNISSRIMSKVFHGNDTNLEIEEDVQLVENKDNLFERLKFDIGVHRLVRISPHDEKGRRHTSFAHFNVTKFDPDKSFDSNVTSLRRVAGRERDILARSYYKNPYKKVVNHKTGTEFENFGEIISGELDQVLEQ